MQYFCLKQEKDFFFFKGASNDKQAFFSFFFLLAVNMCVYVFQNTSRGKAIAGALGCFSFPIMKQPYLSSKKPPTKSSQKQCSLTGLCISCSRDSLVQHAHGMNVTFFFLKDKQTYIKHKALNTVFPSTALIHYSLQLLPVSWAYQLYP